MTCGNCVKAALGLGDLLAQRVDACPVLPTLGIRKRIEQCLVLVAPGGGEVLALAHQGSQSAGTRGEARAHLLDCRRGRGLTGPLGDFDGLVSERRRRLNSLACRNG